MFSSFGSLTTVELNVVVQVVKGRALFVDAETVH